MFNSQSRKKADIKTILLWVKLLRARVNLYCSSKTTICNLKWCSLSLYNNLVCLINLIWCSKTFLVCPCNQECPCNLVCLFNQEWLSNQGKLYNQVSQICTSSLFKVNQVKCHQQELSLEVWSMESKCISLLQMQMACMYLQFHWWTPNSKMSIIFPSLFGITQQPTLAD